MDYKDGVNVSFVVVVVVAAVVVAAADFYYCLNFWNFCCFHLKFQRTHVNAGLYKSQLFSNSHS